MCTRCLIFVLSHQLVEGPQAPQTLTASKSKYDNIALKIQNSPLKNKYLGALTF